MYIVELFFGCFEMLFTNSDVVNQMSSVTVISCIYKLKMNNVFTEGDGINCFFCIIN